MRHRVTIGLVGDYDPSVVAHQAIPVALNGRPSDWYRRKLQWIPTEEFRPWHRLILSMGCGACRQVRIEMWTERCLRFDTPANVQSRSWHMRGFQRDRQYARNVLGWDNAEHAETA
jgi:hypothetical protein